MAHKFLAGVIAGCVLLLSVSQSNRRGEYYFRTADELRYLQDLRQKYSGAKYMLTKEEMPACPVATTVALIGSKWKLLIMRNLLSRPWRFNELKKDLEGISQKVLTDSLRSMEADGLLTRTVYPEVPPRVEYTLTELGYSLRPILEAMRVWGEDYKAAHE